VLIHDTVTNTTGGPAFVRFIRLNAEDGQGDINLFENRANNIIFASVTGAPVREYHVMKSDSSMTIKANYFYQGQPIEDSIILPSLVPHSLQSVILFQQQGNGMIMSMISDSLKLVPPPKGFAYVRFINGLSNYPQPQPIVNVFLDDATEPLMPRPIAFGDAHGYVLVPEGVHELSVRAPGSTSAFLDVQVLVLSGTYYTAKLTGLFATHKLSVTPE
jgi:hypothetical protein